MTISESKGRFLFFLQNESIRIDSNREFECSSHQQFGPYPRMPEAARILFQFTWATSFTVKLGN